MNDEAARQGRPDTSSITAAEDTTASGSSYPRCESCGSRAPSEAFLERHRLRRCVGPVNGRHVVARRLTAAERAEFVRMLRELPA